MSYSVTISSNSLASIIRPDMNYIVMEQAQSAANLAVQDILEYVATEFSRKNIKLSMRDIRRYMSIVPTVGPNNIQFDVSLFDPRMFTFLMMPRDFEGGKYSSSTFTISAKSKMALTIPVSEGVRRKRPLDTYELMALTTKRGVGVLAERDEISDSLTVSYVLKKSVTHKNRVDLSNLDALLVDAFSTRLMSTMRMT